MTSVHRVLIAEDEGLIAEELQMRLRRMGASDVEVVGSGHDAVARARETVPDLILMDIRLKGEVDGIEAATQIRETLDIPVVYLTAHSDDATIARAKLTQPVGYLIKPFMDRELQITIELGLHKHLAEQRLRESEERYAATLTSIGDAVIATDAEGRVTFMNPVAETLTQWRRDDASGQPVEAVLQLIDGATKSGVANPVAEAIRQSTTVALTPGTHLVARNGGAIPIDDSAAPILDRQKRVRGGVVVFRDISDRLRSEEALRRAEQELRQLQRLEAIGRLAGGVAHDMNNLMTVVVGCADMLFDELPAGTAHHHLVKEIQHAGDRAVTLTRQLLAFGRKQLLVPVVIDLNLLVGAAEPLLRRLIGADTTLVSRLQPGAGRVRVDPVRMEQVLVNLALNARDAMPHGGTLTLATRRVQLDVSAPRIGSAIEPGSYAAVSVTDTGAGIAPEARAHIFEPFFTTKESGKATGLGLATVYGMVLQSGGYIDVDSEPGRGTTFTIYLPEIADAPTLATSREFTRAELGSETVLLVEDDPAVRKMTGSILQRAGYTVLQAADGEEALQRYEHDSGIDLLLTDAIMPRLGGRVLAERMVRANPRLLVLFMSGYTEDLVLRLGVEQAAVPFLHKPFSPRELRTAVRRVLDRGPEMP